MAELEDNQLVFIDDKGNEVLCEIIFTYESVEYKKNYVFFKPVGASDEDDNIEVSCASYIPQEDGIGELNEITDDAEWDMLSEVFDSYIQEEVDEDELNCEGCPGCDDGGDCSGCPGCGN